MINLWETFNCMWHADVHSNPFELTVLSRCRETMRKNIEIHDKYLFVHSKMITAEMMMMMIMNDERCEARASEGSSEEARRRPLPN